MDWDKLKIFHAVAEAGSFTSATVNLNLSQSAISRQIQALEEDLKVKLFERHARGCLLYTSDAADDLTRVDLGGRRIIKKKNDETNNLQTERFFFSSRRRHTRFALVSWARRCV